MTKPGDRPVDSAESAPASRRGAQATQRSGGLELSVVAPCFNEEEVLGEFLRRTTDAIGAAGISHYELVLVDDGSTDLTWPTIEHFAGRDPRVVGVKLSRNYGHQVALTAGLARCRGEQVLILDADLQDPPELLADMRALMARERADVVYGRRVSRAGESVFKTVSARLFYRLLDWLTDAAIPVDTGDFRLMSGRLARAVAELPERDRFVRGLVSWSGFKQVPIEYSRQARFAGQTKYPVRKMLSFASDAILGFSLFPLRVAGLISAAFFVAVLGLLVYVVVSWLFLSPIPGWTSLAIIVLAASAAQMLTLTVIGEYVGRIYMEAKRRPLFMVDRVTGGDRFDGVQADHG